MLCLSLHKNLEALLCHRDCEIMVAHCFIHILSKNDYGKS